MVRAIITCQDGTYTRYVEPREIVKMRTMLHNGAWEYMQKIANKPDHVIYYWDERTEDGEIIEAHFYYDLVFMDDKIFNERTDAIRGLVGALHYN